tara:strand:- start:2144 stop:3496 length:1353 start_codon:yes stop_codon:yes gene_type:complete
MGERTRELLILITGDIAVFIVSLYLTLTLRYLAWPDSVLLDAHTGPFFALSLLWLLVFYIAGLYGKHTIFLKKMLLSRIVQTQIINILIAVFLFVVLPFGIAPKTNLLIYLFISLGLLTVWRLKVFPFFAIKERHKAIIIADGADAIELVDEINNNDRYSYSFVRIIDRRTAEDTEHFEEKLFKLIEREGIKIIVADPSSHYTEKVLPGIFDYAFLKFEFVFLDFYKVYEETFDRVPYHSLRYDWFITNISQSKNLVYNFIKRTVDIFFALVLLLPSALLFPFVALAIKLEDKGDLFYITQRVGQYNRPINIYKLRTKNGADSGGAALASQLVDTKVGTFLRKTRIDELPQLINVLRGDLSFVGPRPEMPALAKVYAQEIPYYNARHFMKPGLSGWAQINNYDVPRGGVDVERTIAKLSYDLCYLKNHSLVLDVQIALKTIATILMRTGT